MRARVNWSKGLNSDVLASELAEGFFNDAQNAVVRDGFVTQSGVDIALNGGATLTSPGWIGIADFTSNVTKVLYYNKDNAASTIQAATLGSSVGVFADISPAAVTLPPTARVTDGMFNGVYLINVQETGLYYWTPALANATAVTGALVSEYACPFKYYIFQLGIWDAGTLYPQRVAWSSAAEPGSLPASFTASATNDAGNVDLAETSGDVLDALPLGDALIIYKEDCRYAARYVGGNDVFRFDRLPGDDGILNNGCVVDTPVGHVFVSKNREVLLHQGGACKNLSAGRINSLIERDINLLSEFRVIKNALHSEVWVYNIATGKFLIWNWVTDTWGTHTPVFTVSHLTSGYVSATIDEPVMLGCNTTTLYRIGVGPKRFSIYPTFTSKTSYVTRSGLDLGEPDLVKNLQRSRWNIDGPSAATFSIEHGSAMTADATPTYASAGTYTLGTSDYVNIRATGGRYLAVKCSWTTATTTTAASRLRSADMDLTMGGTR